MITREKAIELLNQNIENENLRKHCYATETIMRSLAEKFDKDKDLWGITGLLHDLDFEITSDKPEFHGIKTEEILKTEDVSQEMINAIKAHNKEYTGVEPETDIAKWLRPAETITGLIVATALIYPDKKIKSVKIKSIKKRMKEKAFARNVNRNTIRECENIGINLPDFIELSLNSMCEINEVLGL